MEPLTLVLLFLVSCVLSLYTWGHIKKRQNLPPGPTPLPVIGNLLQLKSGQLLESLKEMRERYGDVYTLYLGPRRVIVLCGYDAVKEALVDHGEIFGIRGLLPCVDLYFKGHGVIFSNGECWKQLRRFSITTLRNFGMGKRGIEERIKEEAHCLVEKLKEMNGTPFNPTYYFSQVAANVICSIIFGNRYSYGDPEFRRLMHIIDDIFRAMTSFWGQEKQNPSTQFNMKNFYTNTTVLFIAGTETISTTLRHAFLLLLKYPNIRIKVQKEIDQVIGRQRAPEQEDRESMPYTVAVIHEIQRYANVLPMNLPHAVSRDFKFRGFTLPQGTDVFPILAFVLQDPKYFPDPFTFNPDRFLDQNGRFKKNDAFLVFSAGKRVCIGEGMARLEMFIFLTKLLQNFDIKSPIDLKDLDITPQMVGFSNVPRPYQISFIPR
ncbi:cytochrome P450 2B11-like isoform X3 [Pseudophryne corroboree]|uniref:cytochrome P450 2B11-like isoform X3 n=1 Tax=Pseudophryne corroboree TaxID=495146 RepID=UPI003081E37E